MQVKRHGERSRPTLNRATNEGERKTKMKRSCFYVAAVSVITITAAFQPFVKAAMNCGLSEMERLSTTTTFDEHVKCQSP